MGWRLLFVLVAGALSSGQQAKALSGPFEDQANGRPVWGARQVIVKNFGGQQYVPIATSCGCNLLIRSDNLTIYRADGFSRPYHDSPSEPLGSIIKIGREGRPIPAARMNAAIEGRAFPVILVEDGVIFPGREDVRYRNIDGFRVVVRCKQIGPVGGRGANLNQLQAHDFQLPLNRLVGVPQSFPLKIGDHSQGNGGRGGYESAGSNQTATHSFESASEGRKYPTPYHRPYLFWVAVGFWMVGGMAIFVGVGQENPARFLGGILLSGSAIFLVFGPL